MTVWKQKLPRILSFAWVLSAPLLLLQAQAPQNKLGSIVRNRAPLQPNRFDPLPLGSIEPQGWLRRQLEIQASGLTGHLDEFWKDVGPNSGWLGGNGESWERGPYYLDGLLPLAYELHDTALIQKARQWVEWTLTHQADSGQIGPASNADWWPRMVMLKVLTQYQEASGDPRVIPLMQKYFAFELRELPGRPLQDWGKYRWQDNVYSVLWLYNRTGTADLLRLAKLLHAQGYDWEAEFQQFPYTVKETREDLRFTKDDPLPDRAMQTHGVNNAMALKAAPIWWLLTGNPRDRQALGEQLNLLDHFHGLPNGMFSGDEHFAGTDPSQGIELCAVVEAMFSLEQAFAELGDARLADRLEKIAYNALPGTISNDMWSHQYDQQPNQIACTRAKRDWSTNGPDSNLFGLEPNFGCCTANLHQGWPKLVSSLWMATADGGLVTAAYAPNRVRTVVNGADLTIDEETDYPFRQSVRFTVHTSRPQRFPLVLRIPAWATGASVTVGGKTQNIGAPGCSLSLGVDNTCHLDGAFFPIQRVWRNGDQVSISFAAQPRVTHWFHDAAVFEQGPLVFALSLDGKWTALKQNTALSADWEITPTRDWNYAVELGKCNAVAVEHAVSAVPFDLASPSLSLQIKGRRLPEWSMVENSAGPVPVSPVSSSGPLETLTLVPYGAAKLRITAFPYLSEKSGCPAVSRMGNPGNPLSQYP